MKSLPVVWPGVLLTKTTKRCPALAGLRVGIAVTALGVSALCQGEGLSLAQDADGDADRDAGAPLAFDAPSGPWVDLGERRPVYKKKQRACSQRFPICVHASADGDERRLSEVLRFAESAWAALTGPLRFPAPDPDLATGAYDLFVVPKLSSEPPDALGATYISARDSRGGLDRASAFTLLQDGIASPCMLEHVVTRELARAIFLRAAPAADAVSVLADSTYLARLLVPCSAIFVQDVADFQRHPERTLFDGSRPWPDASSGKHGRGASLFSQWLDARFGSEPGAALRGLWALRPTKTPSNAPRWVNEPDHADVLRVSFKGALGMGSTVDDLWTAFGTIRWFTGQSPSVSPFPEGAVFGGAAKPPVAWEIPWPAKPRRLACPHPVAPLGTSYVLVTGIPPRGTLRVEVEWEEQSSFRWSALKLAADGAKLAEWPLVGFRRGTRVQRSLAELDGASSVLLVGTNVGDPAYGFDPDDEAWEPHGYLITLAAE